MLAGQKCTGVGGDESGDPELILMGFRGYDMFPDKLPVNAGDVSTRVYQCRGVDDFEGV